MLRYLKNGGITLKKILIITASTALALTIMSGGYALWRSELTISGDIYVTVPDNVYENISDVITFTPITEVSMQEVSDVYRENETIITIIEE